MINPTTSFDSTKDYLVLNIDSESNLDFYENLNYIYIYLSNCTNKVESEILSAYKNNSSIEFIGYVDEEVYLCKGIPTMIMIGISGYLNYFRFKYETISNITRIYNISLLTL